MRTCQLNVDSDGCVEIPDTHPGEIVSIQGTRAADAAGDRSEPIPEAERSAIKERILRRAQKTRERLPQPWRSAGHGNLLYGENGLPR